MKPWYGVHWLLASLAPRFCLQIDRVRLADLCMPIAYNDLQIEEIFQDEQGGRAIESSLHNVVFYAFYLFVLAVFSIFVGRSIYLGILKKELYSNRALANTDKEVYVPAPRGVIYDRFHNVLASNEASFSVSLKLSEYREHKSEINTYLRETIGITVQEIDEAISRAKFEESDLVIITSDISQNEIIKLKAKEMPGLYIEDDFRRVYPYRDVFAHSVGYVDPENTARSGIEAFYDDILRGEDGTILRQYDARGELLDHRELGRPYPGKDIVTTFDAEFQSYFHNRLRDGLQALNRRSGVGIALDPRNGEVLALVNLPSFDANMFAKRGDEELQEKKLTTLTLETKPLFNRALAGVYNPGSTIKPLVAVAALSEGVVNPERRILSRGYLELPNPYNPDSSSRFLDWRAHGLVNVRSALSRSSNVYFYVVGGGFPSANAYEIGAEGIKGLGIERLIKWWKIFGLGTKTGIDLLGESDGFLPNPYEKEKRTGVIWRIGDTYNVAIGQGDLLITPLQLVNYISAVATGGVVYRPHVNYDLMPEVIQNIAGLEEGFREVQAGMRDAVRESYGTAHLFGTLPFEVAAKTGTAQIQNNEKTNAFTVAYAPYDYPQIVILVLVEDSREGSLNTVPIARDVLGWYYKNRITVHQIPETSN